ncbi:MAG TPA: peptidylprolyl isomerase, partial [Candidatus Omnitrophota bacterium]|nr:peptidylprolyl isomerase [Candidatus Omnitrophota bacterium]
MLARLAVLATVVVAALSGNPAMAQQDLDRIAAVVNDEVITIKDVEQRVRMAMALSNLPDSADARRRVLPQVVRKMIDERLQMQEAGRLKISLSPADVDNGLAAIEQQSRQPRGALVASLQRAGVDPSVVREQIRADLTWLRVATRVLQPTIRIGEEEVKDRLETISSRQGQPEYLPAEIFLPIENPAQEEEMQRLGERLLEQLRSGAPFAALARQFSRAPTAGNGGAMGWVSGDMIDEDLFNVIKDMSPNQVSQLIRGGDGFRIVALVDRRIAGAKADPAHSTVTLSQILLPVPPDGPPRQSLMARASEVTRGARSCDELEA